MGDYTCRIERMSNGYSVRLDDPKIRAANAKPENKKWRDPTREFVFKTTEEVLEFLKKNLDKALPQDDYDTAFDIAVTEDTDNDGK